jgi:hypothetical protein
MTINRSDGKNISYGAQDEKLQLLQNRMETLGG